MFREMFTDVVAIMTALLVVGLAIITTTSLVIAYTFSQPFCREKGIVMNLNTRWSYSTGCMVSIKDQFVPLKDVVPVEVDGKIIFTVRPQQIIVTK